MKFTAILKTKSKDAESVSQALEVDNVDMKDLGIKTGFTQDRIITKVESNNIGSLLSSLDDVIKCQMVAEDIIKKMKNSQSEFLIY